MILLALTKGQILRHIFLPGIVPRLKTFLSKGFDNLAYYMALVYRAVNILPNNHPYTERSNIGRYGVIRVLSEASNNLKFDKNNIDKIIIYFVILAGIFLLIFQFLLLLAAIMVGPALAQIPTSYSGFITTPNPKTDIAFRLLSQVFGVPGIFGPTAPTTPTAFHTAMHTLFQYYSTGILVVAAIIIAYFVFVVLAETAQTGTPFGKRFNHVWAPIRLVVAIGLLIPVSYGMNSAQWITLHAAKFGSGFATQGWIRFNQKMTESYLGKTDDLVATPNVPRLRELANFMMIAKACKYAYEETTKGYKVPKKIEAYLVKNYDSVHYQPISSYDAALKFYNNDAVIIRFGEYNKAYTKQTGNVYPYCGDLVLSTTHINKDGAWDINQAYFDLIKKVWTSAYFGMKFHAQNYIKREIYNTSAPVKPGPGFRDNIVKQMEKEIGGAITQAVAKQKNEYTTNPKYAEQGWAGAGIWYNQIAQVNGTLIAAAANVPYAQRFPSVMEYYKYKNLQNNEHLSGSPYSAIAKDGEGIPAEAENEVKISKALSAINDYWADEEERSTGNIFIDVVNVIFGTKGLFDMCANANVHPMAQLSALGKGLIESAIRNIGFAAIGGAAGFLSPYFGAALSAASSFLFSVASIGILIGFILFYLVPFLPFLYFFFAVGGWIKGLFEAMVGLPLWALAHLRIDGEGLPGDAAINGYFLIFEIFLRPILIVFGLLAAVSIFAAMVKILNEIFALATSNLAGFEGSTATTCTGSGGSAPVGSAQWVRGPIDEFFFTVMYAILVYMIGMSTFKLIDMIPNNILRWMGTGVNTYNDQSGETAEGLMQKVSIGGSMISGQVQGALGQLGGVASGIKQGIAAKNQPSE